MSYDGVVTRAAAEELRELLFLLFIRVDPVLTCPVCHALPPVQR